MPGTRPDALGMPPLEAEVSVSELRLRALDRPLSRFPDDPRLRRKKESFRGAEVLPKARQSRNFDESLGRDWSSFLAQARRGANANDSAFFLLCVRVLVRAFGASSTSGFEGLRAESLGCGAGAPRSVSHLMIFAKMTKRWLFEP